MTFKWIAAATGFDQDVRPDQAGFDMHRRDFDDADADLILAEPRTFVADDRPVVHLNDRAEKVVAFRPPACFENFRIHTATLVQEVNLGNTFKLVADTRNHLAASAWANTTSGSRCNASS